MARKLITHVPEDEELKNIVESLIHVNGMEYPCNQKLFIEGEKTPLTLEQRVEKIFNHHLIKRNMQITDQETWEESNDFDIPDEEPMEISGYEIEDMIEEVPADIKRDIVPPEEVEPVTPEPAEPATEPEV